MTNDCYFYLRSVAYLVAGFGSSPPVQLGKSSEVLEEQNRAISAPSLELPLVITGGEAIFIRLSASKTVATIQRVKYFLLEARLIDQLPVVIVCDCLGFV